MTDQQDIIERLTDDGDTVELGDGRTLRLRIEADDLSVLDEQGEGVWCGRLEWDDGARNAYGWNPRPEGFDGRAEVLVRDNGHRLWWQVPADIEPGSEGHAALRRHLLDLLEYGYRCAVLEVLRGEDAYGRPIVRQATVLGGIEPFPDAAYVAEVVGDLLSELGVLS